jgi:hypothetical protein
MPGNHEWAYEKGGKLMDRVSSCQGVIKSKLPQILAEKLMDIKIFESSVRIFGKKRDTVYIVYQIDGIIYSWNSQTKRLRVRRDS